MSRWFASAKDLSDSESSDSSAEEDKKPQQPTAATTAAKKGVLAAPKRAYMKGFEESSDSEEENRVVKTTKDKRTEQLQGLMQDLKNHLKINDFTQIQNDFDKLTEELERTHGQVIFQDGKEGILPNMIIRALVKIEDAITETTQQTKDKKLTLNKTNAVSLNKLKQKLKKYLSTTGPSDNNYEKQIAKFREAPVWSEDERKAKESKQGTKKAAAKEEKKKAAEESEEESEEEESEEEESEEEESEEESEESEEEIDIFKVPREQLTPAQRRLKWVKKDRLPLYLQQQLAAKQSAKQKDRDEKKKENLEKGQQEANQLQSALGKEKEKEGEKETVINRKNDFQVDYSKWDNIHKKLKEIQEERMRSKNDARYHSQLLTFMLEQAKENRQKIEITLNLLNSLYDTAKTTVTGFLSRDLWLITASHLQNLMGFLENSQFKASMRQSLSIDVKAEAVDGEIDGELSTTVDIEKSILPSLVNNFEKLDNELLKAYQFIPHFKIDYLQRIRDENKLLFLLDQVSNYIQEFNDKSKLARLDILKLDHLYYKQDNLYAKMKESNTADAYIPAGESEKVIEDLVARINQFGTSRMKLRAALYQIYHHSIHKRFYNAKDLLLKTHIADIIHLQDIGSQILYNRAITQTGMAAFRLGLIQESHDILVDVCQTAKLREILAQGYSRQADKPIELEKEEQKRQIPFHLHINLQLLDCVYMISAMLLEIANIAENQFSVNKKIISKNFKKLIDQYDAKAFSLAPENYRDNIVYAAKQLNKSNWKSAIDQVFSIKLITQMPEFKDEGFRQNLTTKFKETAIKAYLMRAAKTYQSFSVDSLSQIFDISKDTLVVFINKLVLKNKFQAHFTQDHSLLILDQSSNDFKELQQLSLQYVDKLEAMVENNERLIDMLAGGSLYQHKERTATEIQMINLLRKQKMFMKQQNQAQLSLNVGSQVQRRGGGQ